MARPAIMSIKPHYARLIKSGAKRVEFRRNEIRYLDRVIFYETKPVQMCTCETRIVHVMRGAPGKVWAQSQGVAGIDYSTYILYVGNRSEVTALFFNDVLLYDKPKPLSAFGIENPPQSFVYLGSGDSH